MLRHLLRRRLLAFTLIEVMAVSGLMAGLSSQGGYQYAITAANQTKGIENLKQIYALIMAQSIGGALPPAAFYPAGDPKTDPKSILKLLPGAESQLFVSPFAPDALKAKGLTFAWNDAVNGRELDQVPKHTWLLVDLAAFIADPNVPKPTRYLILYADGTATAVPDLPEDIQKAVKEAQAKAPKTGENAKPKAQ